MGKAGVSAQRSHSRSTSSSSSNTLESPLSQEQLAILQERRTMFNDLFYPELKSGMNLDNPNSESFASVLHPMTNAVNQSYANLQEKSMQNLMQRGLAGDQGVSSALAAENERSRMSLLSEAYFNSLLAGQNRKDSYLKLGLAASPSPTTSAQYHQTSESKSKSKSGAWGFSASGGVGPTGS